MTYQEAWKNEVVLRNNGDFRVFNIDGRFFLLGININLATCTPSELQWTVGYGGSEEILQHYIIVN